MKRDDDRHSEKLVGWLANFADKLGDKNSNISPQEHKNAGHIENILDIVNRNKKTSVDAKVEEYRRLVGLDFIDSIEKEGRKEANKEAMAKKPFEIGQLWSGIQDNPETDPKVSTPTDFFNPKNASRMVISIRDKVAQDERNDGLKMDKIKQYIGEVIRNRNGAIATPAILDQLENYMKADKVDKEWLRRNLEQIEGLISNARAEFHPNQNNEIPVNELARTDNPSRGEKEAPLFLPPATSPV